MMHNEKKAIAALIAISITSFLVPFVGSSLNLALPHIARDLGMNAVTLSLVVSAYLLVCAMFQMSAARIGDLLGRRKIYILGIALFSVGSLLCGIAWSPASLIIFRALTGIGSAMMFGTAMAILVTLFPTQKRGLILGINSAVVYFALASGPFLGGILAHNFGWRSIFFICFVAGFIAILTSLAVIDEEWREAQNEPFDVKGSLVYAFSLFAMIYGLSLMPNLESWLLLLCGVIAAVAFVIYEKRCCYPILDLNLFSGNRTFRFSTIAAMINYLTIAAPTFLLSLYLQIVRGLDAQQAGFFLMLQPIAQIIFTLLAGRWSERIDPSRIATGGMIFVSLAILGLCFLTPTTAWTQLIGILIFFGVGFGMFASPNTNVIMNSVDKKYYGMASAVTGTARLIGQASSIAIATLAIHIYLGVAEVSASNQEAFMKSLHLTCVIFSGFCLFGIYASAARFYKWQP
ncbi:MAG: MFS transporter [Burkholderiales bacterium]|jgi:EmrB/QacA subfamily drug resistance transporter|nr:MFS transporter [Burkholderiales bacterium]